MGCANSLAKISEAPQATIEQSLADEIPKVVDIAIQKDDPEISPLQPRHYNSENTSKTVKRFVYGDQDVEDWLRREVASIEEKSCYRFGHGVDRAGTLELDNFEPKIEILSKSDNMYSADVLQGSPKNALEHNLDNFEAISLIHENKFHHHSSGLSRKELERYHTNPAREGNRDKRATDVGQELLPVKSKTKKIDTVTELIMDTFKSSPPRDSATQVDIKNQNQHEAIEEKQVQEPMKSPENLFKTLFLKSRKNSDEGKLGEAQKDELPLSKITTEVPDSTHLAMKALNRRLDLSVRSRSLVSCQRPSLEKQDKDWEPIQEFLDTVTKALNQHRENNKETLNPQYFPGRRLARCLSSAPKSLASSLRLESIINEFKSVLKARLAAKKSAGNETKPRQPYNPKRNYRTVKHKPLISVVHGR